MMSFALKNLVKFSMLHHIDKHVRIIVIELTYIFNSILHETITEHKEDLFSHE